MKTNNLILPIATALIGVLFGYLMFSSGNSDQQKEEHTAEIHKKDEVWTCSMHPQIRRPEPGDCPICGMELIPLTANGSDSKLTLEMPEDAIRLANIKTSIVGGLQSQKGNLKLSGKVQINEENSASLVTQIPGRIERLYVSFKGEQVNKGQRIALIYSPVLINAQRELLEAYKIKDNNPNLLEAAKRKLSNWKISDAQIQSILNEKEVKETFEIYANYSGVIRNKNVVVGDHLKEGESLFDVENLNTVWVIFDAYENDILLLKLGYKITFTTPALPADSFTAKITFIDPAINPATRTVAVRVEVNNSQKKLKPEMFVQGEIQISNAKEQQQILIPKSAVLWTGERSVIYVKIPNTTVPTFEYREVIIGETIGDEITILEGLNIGEEIVTNGAFVIDASAQLNNRSSMMNRNIENNIHEEKKVVDLPEYSTETPDAFKSQLSNLLQHYLDLKNVLIKSDLKNANAQIELIIQSLAKVKMSLVKGEAHIYWMKKHNNISSLTQEMLTLGLTGQREKFAALSIEFEHLIKVFGIADSKLFVQSCPMANNKAGATWISEFETIKNPYYGDQMLGCGSVQEIINATK